MLLVGVVASTLTILPWFESFILGKLSSCWEEHFFPLLLGDKREVGPNWESVFGDIESRISVDFPRMGGDIREGVDQKTGAEKGWVGFLLKKDRWNPVIREQLHQN